MALMNAKDAISGSLGECYVTIDGQRYHLVQVLSVKVDIEKTKKEIPIMGKVGKGNKATGAKIKGSAKLYYNTSLFRKLLIQYLDTGEDFYFDMVIKNEDPTSKVGVQIVQLLNCNINNGVLAHIDAEAETLDEEFEFTVESVKLSNEFNELEIMKG